MILDINNQMLALYYSKARENYNKCIKNEENAFLQEELSVPFDTIELRESNIKVVFHDGNTETYMLEISITLWDSSNQILGKYVYIEDDKENAVDDSLVFF